VGVRQRRARQKSLLRQEILDAARDIIIRDGYEGLSMRKVAQKIDYSPTAIYLHFKDREELLFSACEEAMAGLVRELQAVTEKHTDPLVALRSGLRRYVEFGLANPQQYAVTFMVPQRPGALPSLEAKYRDAESMGMRAFAFLPRILAEAARQKKIAKVDVEVAGRALWAGVHVITSLLIGKPLFDWGVKDRVIDQVIDILVGGLKPAR
jgi:AcrR family transcriptional regulator